MQTHARQAIHLVIRAYTPYVTDKGEEDEEVVRGRVREGEREGKSESGS